MAVYIFTEGGDRSGLGHISRCSSLYDELYSRGITVELIVHSESDKIDFLQGKQYQVINWLSKAFLMGFLTPDDDCIVDSYLASKEICTVISHCARKVLFIDDNGRIEYPEGIVVNPSLSTKAVTYPVSDTNCYLLGPKYIILRSPFIQVIREYINPRVKEVLITLGGSDIHNLTPMILKQLAFTNPDIIFNVVIGTAFNNIDEIKSVFSNNINFYEHAAAEDMKSLMLRSDFAITAAGQTIYELLATQTPFIPIKIIENQNNNVAGLKEYKLVSNILCYEDMSLVQKIEDEFIKLLNINKRTQIINIYTDVIDGLGSKRIIDRLVDNKEVR